MSSVLPPHTRHWNYTVVWTRGDRQMQQGRGSRADAPGVFGFIRFINHVNVQQI